MERDARQASGADRSLQIDGGRRAAVALAQGEGLEVAVRGGGHNVSGLPSTEGGVMIDLRPMNRVLVDPDRRRVRVQGGALLGELDRATHVFGLATPAGWSLTGAAGSPGGGYGWLARLHGLACDNLISVELVTASGEVVVGLPRTRTRTCSGGSEAAAATRDRDGVRVLIAPPSVPLLSAQLRYAAGESLGVLRAYRDTMTSAPPELCSLIVRPAEGRAASATNRVSTICTCGSRSSAPISTRGTAACGIRSSRGVRRSSRWRS